MERAAHSEAREIEERVREALALLDGSRDRAVEILSGLLAERIDELGGAG